MINTITLGIVLAVTIYGALWAIRYHTFEYQLMLDTVWKARLDPPAKKRGVKKK